MKQFSLAVLCILLVAGVIYEISNFHFCVAQSSQYESIPEKVSPDFASQFLPPNHQGLFDKIPTRLDARYIHAFLVCEDDFQKSGLGSKTDISNYEGIYFWEDKKYYYVIFISRKLAPKARAGVMLLDGEKIFGQDTRYLVRKTDFIIAKRTFINY